MNQFTDSMWILSFFILFLYMMPNNILLISIMIFSMVYLYKYKYKYIDIIDNIIKPEKTDNNDVHYNDEIL